MKFIVLKVRSRAEKKVRLLCKYYNIPCYLPTYFQQKKYQRRTVTTEKPVFPGYVFASAANTEKHRLLLASGLVYSTFSVTNPRQLIKQLREIKKLLAYTPEKLTVTDYKVGDVVQIIDGPFTGIRGIVEKNKDTHCKLYLNIDILGQSIVVEIHNDMVATL